MIIQLQLGPMENFCYIIYDKKSKEGAVIDPGWEIGELVSKIEKEKIKIKYILLTHLHFDHSQGIRQLKKKVGGEIVSSNKEPGSEFLEKIVKEGDELLLGKEKIKVVEVPGHSQGGLCFIFEEGLFTGDTYFKEGIYGRSDFPGGNEKDLEQSIERIKEFIKKGYKVYPGHDY